MARMRTRADSTKQWATFVLVVFALNFGWEMTQGRWFASMQGLPFWRATFLCARATLGDFLITSIAYAAAAAIGMSWTWPTGDRVVIATIIFLAVGVGITAAYEVVALSRGAWVYDRKMPTVLGVGLLPLLQWLLLPLIEVMLFRA